MHCRVTIRGKYEISLTASFLFTQPSGSLQKQLHLLYSWGLQKVGQLVSLLLNFWPLMKWQKGFWKFFLGTTNIIGHVYYNYILWCIGHHTFLSQDLITVVTSEDPKSLYLYKSYISICIRNLKLCLLIYFKGTVRQQHKKRPISNLLLVNIAHFYEKKKPNLYFSKTKQD